MWAFLCGHRHVLWVFASACGWWASAEKPPCRSLSYSRSLFSFTAYALASSECLSEERINLQRDMPPDPGPACGAFQALCCSLCQRSQDAEEPAGCVCTWHISRDPGVSVSTSLCWCFLFIKGRSQQYPLYRSAVRINYMNKGSLSNLIFIIRYFVS